MPDATTGPQPGTLPACLSRNPGAQGLLAELAQARSWTDRLFERVPGELLFERPIPQRHRIAFYVGHLEAFDVNLLGAADSIGAEADRLDRLFAFGIDPPDGELPQDQPWDWPEAHAIHGYAERTRARVDQWLRDRRERVADEPLGTLVQAAIEHRWMHAETLAYLLERMPLSEPPPAGQGAGAGGTVSDEDMVSVPAGPAQLGASRGEPRFAWDNEYPALTVAVDAFLIDRYMVTNAQYLRFVQAGGYESARWWSPRDWQWRESQGLNHPLAWERREDRWQLRTRASSVPLPADWPVYVSHAEASAYARWIGKSLPSEAQWQRAAYAERDSESMRSYPWGEEPPGRQHGHFDFRGWEPVSVTSHPAGASAFGVMGLLGNGWEWTRSLFAPLPGFQAQRFYPGYSANFFDGRHFVLKGGCAHTAARLLRRSFRNWFQPRYPYVFAGFRCARPA